MSEAISVVERGEQHALCISETVGTMRLGKVMGPAYQAILKRLQEQNIELSDRDIPFTIYKHIEWNKVNQKGLLATIHMMFFHKWDMDIGIPCPESVRGEGNIKDTTLESGKFVRAVHRGPYMKVGNTYQKILLYSSENNCSFKDYSIEFYLNDPREVPASQLETEVLVPLQPQ